MFGHVIVDGPDAVGKTTFVEAINKKFGFETIHSIADSPNNFTYYTELLNNPNHQFYDRFLSSEFVYSKLYKRTPRLSISEMSQLLNSVITTNSLYIIMTTTNLSILKQRLIARGELDYLTEITEQVTLFNNFVYTFENYFENYDNFKWVDISDPDAYNKLYTYADNFITINLSKT